MVVFGAAGWLGRAILSGAGETDQITAFDRGPQDWDTWKDLDGASPQGRIIHGDISDFTAVDAAVSDMDAVIHTAVYFPSSGIEEDNHPFLINLKGLWNVLESARRKQVRTVVHVGSCQTIHPKRVFFDAKVRRPDGSLYAVCKRLQEEMCRQFHDAFGMRIVVLRPDYIVDSRLGIGRHREKLGGDSQAWRHGWVCRHDLAEACLLAARNNTIAFEILHIVGTAGSEQYCNVARSKEVLGLDYRGDLDQYR